MANLNDGISLVSVFNFGNFSGDKRCAVVNQPNPVLGTIMIALVVIGLIGNFLVFFTILVLREYRKSVTNWYILQLTLADSLFLLMLPITAQSVIVGKWNFELTLCKFKEAIIFINYYASIYFLVIMSFDRYLAVTKAFVSSQWVTTLRSSTSSYIISIIGWILSALLCIQLYQNSDIDDCKICQYSFLDPYSHQKPSDEANDTDIQTFSNFNELNKLFTILSSDDNSDAESGNSKESGDSSGGNEGPPTECRLPDNRELRIWLYGNFVGMYILPLALICFFYGMIMRTITSATSIGDNERQKAYRRRVTLIVLALVSLFGLSWLPWYVEKLVKIHGIKLNEENCLLLSDIVRAIAYLNSAFNPYFYSFLGFHFRERLKRASGQVRLFPSLRTRASVISSVKRKRHSSSNSAGSIRAGPSPSQPNFPKATTKVERPTETPRLSLAQKTERTLV